MSVRAISPSQSTVLIREICPGAADDTLEAELDLGGHPVIVYVSRMDQAVCLVALAAGRLSQRSAVKSQASGSWPSARHSLKQLRDRAEEVNRSGLQLVTMTGPRTDINRILASGEYLSVFPALRWRPWRQADQSSLPAARVYGGFLRRRGLDDALRNNFTGRGAASCAEKLRDDIVRALNLSRPSGRNWVPLAAVWSSSTTPSQKWRKTVSACMKPSAKSAIPS